MLRPKTISGTVVRTTTLRYDEKCLYSLTKNVRKTYSVIKNSFMSNRCF